MAVFAPVVYTSAATSVGNNVTIGGTLTVSGLNSFTSGFVSAASSTVNSALTVNGSSMRHQRSWRLAFRRSMAGSLVTPHHPSVGI